MTKFKKLVTISWLLTVAAIASITFTTGKVVMYVQEFKEADPLGEIKMKKYDQAVEKELITPTPKPTTWTGTASWYSREGCIGCSPTLTMANGQPLDDNRLTVAFNRAKLGSRLLITNVSNGESVEATVTDTGGFERHGRIIDVTPAVRDAIDMKDLETVEVRLLELINNERQKHSLAPLKQNNKLNKVAMCRAKYLVKNNKWTHDGWLECFTGITGKRGENLARNFNTDEATLLAWMNSPTHRDNILHKYYNYIGIAKYKNHTVTTFAKEI